MTVEEKKELDAIAEGVKTQMEDVKKAQEKLGEDIDDKITKAIEEAKVDGNSEELAKMRDETKTEITNVTEKYKEVTDRFDTLETELKRVQPSSVKNDNWATEFKEALNSDSYKNYRKGDSNTFSYSVKAGDMTGANTFTNDVVPPDRQDQLGVIFDPDRAEHVRDILPVGATTSDKIQYQQETAYDNGVDTTAEGATKPQSDFDITQQEAPVRKIATYLRMSEEMLDDVPFLQSYITTRVPSKIKNDEDTQILYGSGVAPNLTGITVSATAYTDELADSTATRWDVLRMAIKQARTSEYRANWICLHPTDFALLELSKDGDGRFILPSILTGGTPMVSRVPIFESTAITADDFLVGDFSKGAQIFDRMQSRIRFYEQDQDNVIKNLITIVAEERIALPIWRTSAFIYGNFTTALANATG